MSPFWTRHRGRPVAAAVGEGFVATEAPALQSAITSAFHLAEGKGQVIVTEVGFAPGIDGRVVVTWRNHYVGFVPDDLATLLRAELESAGKAGLVAPARVYHDGKWWRVWVGPEPAGTLPVPEPGYDTLEPPPPTIFGIPLRRPDTGPKGR